MSRPCVFPHSIYLGLAALGILSSCSKASSPEAPQKKPATTTQGTHKTASKAPVWCQRKDLAPLLSIACAGGGRPFLEGFLAKSQNAIPSMTQMPLKQIVTSFPSAKANKTIVVEGNKLLGSLLSNHIQAMYPTAEKTGEAAKWKAWSDFSSAGRSKLWTELRMDPDMHYNSQNGTLGMLLGLDSLSGEEAQYTQALKDFPGSSKEKLDQGRARNLGENLGSIAFGLNQGGLSPAEVSKLLVGPIPQN